MPRTKGSKSKVGIPIKGLPEAIQLVKMAYDIVGDKSMSFQEITNFMKLPKGISTPVIGAISEYHLIEKSNLGWRVSELGKSAIFGDTEAIKQAFTKNPIFADLYQKFGDKEVTSGIIENYLRSRYKKGENVLIIVNRFLEGLNLTKGTRKDYTLEPTGEPMESSEITKWFKVIQLKTALNPSKIDISKLADDIANGFGGYNDSGIKTLSKSIKENKNNKEVLAVLVDNLLKIGEEIYPEFLSFTQAETKKHENDEE